LLSFTDPKYKAVYDTMRYRLEDIINSFPETITQFINCWIGNNAGDLKKISVLDEIIFDMYSKHPKEVEKLFLEWLMSEDSSYKIALKFVVSHLSTKIEAVGLPKDSLRKLSETDSLYLI